MNYKEEMELLYSFFTSNAIKVKNPNLDVKKEQREQLIICGCGCNFIVCVNGKSPISDTIMVGVVCPNCGINASDWAIIKGHSAGCFNASIFRYGA